MYCKKCGAPNENPNATNCMYCGAPLGAQTYYGHVPCVSRKSIPLYLVLTILTCGIFSLFWIANLTEDVNSLTGDHSVSGGMTVLFIILTCGIYGFIWAYKQGEKIDWLKQSRGIPSSNTNILYLVLAIIKLQIVNLSLMQNEVNQYAA